MYSLYSPLLLFLFFIAQIAAAEAFVDVHGRFPRLNHADNPNVSALPRTYPGVQGLTGT